MFIDTPTGKKELSKIAAPTVLGEISFFSGEPNSATVMTVKQVQALVMPFEVLRQRLHNGDAASSIVMLNMAGAIRTATAWLHAQRASEMTRKISELYSRLPDDKL